MPYMPGRMGAASTWWGGPSRTVNVRQGHGLDIDSVQSGDAMNLGLLQALQQVSQAGLQRTASPMGSIAQNLAPLFGAMIYARALEAQSAGAAQEAQQKSELNQSQIDLNRARAAAAGGGTKGPQKFEAAILERIANNQPFDDIVAAMKATTKPEKPGEWDYRTREAQGDPFAQKVMGQKRSDEAMMSGVRADQQAQAQLGKQKDYEMFRRSLPAAMTDTDRKVISNGIALTELLDQADQVVASIPKDISRTDYARNMGKYQTRSDYPMASNLLTSLTGGLVTPDTDPRLDPIASYIGQVQSSLASWSVQNQRGGIRMIQYLRDHFPNYADSPEQVRSKLEQLRSKKSYIKMQIQAFNDQFEKAAKVATELPPEHGAEAQGGVVKMPWTDAAGKQHFMFIDPTTGAAVNGDQ